MNVRSLKCLNSIRVLYTCVLFLLVLASDDDDEEELAKRNR